MTDEATLARRMQEAMHTLMARCNPYRRPDDIHPATLLDWARRAEARREEAGAGVHK